MSSCASKIYDHYEFVKLFIGLECQFSGHAGGMILLSVFHMASFHYVSSSF